VCVRGWGQKGTGSGYFSDWSSRLRTIEVCNVKGGGGGLANGAVLEAILFAGDI
jgi:hypothetical protein